MRDYLKVFVTLALVIFGFMLTANGLTALGLLPSSVSQALAIGMAAPAAAQGTASAEVVNYGTDRDLYNRGDTAKGFITIRNTGSTEINDVTISVSVSRSVPILGMMKLGSQDVKLTGLHIAPGETKDASYSVTIPSEFKGISTAGDYKVSGTAYVGDRDIGSFSKSIKVV